MDHQNGQVGVVKLIIRMEIIMRPMQGALGNRVRGERATFCLFYFVSENILERIQNVCE